MTEHVEENKTLSEVDSMPVEPKREEVLVYYDINGKPIGEEAVSPAKEAVVSDPVESSKEEESQSRNEDDYSKYVEEEARSHGWKPKEEYIGAKGRWVDAKTYIERTTLFQKQRADKQRIEEISKALDSTLKLLKSSEERSYKKAKEDLEQELSVARNTNDIGRYDNANKLLQDLDKEHELQQQQLPTQTVSPNIQNWVSKNSWFGGNTPLEQTMTEHAKRLSKEYTNSNVGNYIEEEDLNYVDKHMREDFPNFPIFKSEVEIQAQKERPSVMGSPTAGTNASKSYAPAKVGDEDRRIQNLPWHAQDIVQGLKRNNQDYKTYLTYIEKELKSGNIKL